MSVPARSRRARRGEGDEGVVLVLVALTVTALLIVTALVIDMGHVRGSARASQSVVDLAALAAGPGLEEEKYGEACVEAVRFLNANAGLDPSVDPGPFCAQMNVTVCSGGTVPQAAPTAASGDVTVRVRFPVPDAEIVDPRVTGGLYENDGYPCQRMRVELSSTDPAFFGGVAGASEYTTTRSATVKASRARAKKAPALWLLEPYGCVALNVNGSGTSAIIGDLSADPPIEGLVSIDSSGEDCSGSQATLSVAGRLHALPTTGTPPGEIRLHALPRLATSCTLPACVQADVSAGRVAPLPVALPNRLTRGPVDHRWNCRSSYPDYRPTTSKPGIPIAPCDAAGDRDPYIDQLRAFVGTSGTPAGFQTYPAGQCNVSGHVVMPPGNWHVPCATLRISAGNSLTFQGGNVVFDGLVRTLGSGSIRINVENPTPNLPESCTSTLCPRQSSADAAWIYLRSGDLDVSGAFAAHNTAVYVHDGIIQTGGGGELRWTAPLEGPLVGLAAWSEKPGTYKITGSGQGNRMAGTFFTPFSSPMQLTGGQAWDLMQAQFVARLLVISGGATLQMAPNETDGVTIPPPVGVLIR